VVWKTRRENSSPYRDSNSDPSAAQLVASLYTDYGIPACEGAISRGLNFVQNILRNYEGLCVLDFLYFCFAISYRWDKFLVSLPLACYFGLRSLNMVRLSVPVRVCVQRKTY
jgi:hypothetical protein